MHVDVVLPTFNRAPLLRRALQSLLEARVPAGMVVAVYAVDNNSRDETRAVIESFGPAFAANFDGGLQYVFEAAPGRSHALNAGLRRARGAFVGMIDDDEQVDAGWFEEIARAFSDPDLDFITGPYAPDWGAEPPAWLPRRPSSVIGWVDGGPAVRTFGLDYDGVLMGGNAVIRRSLLDRVGGYDPTLGRTGDGRLLSCEDEEMQRRIMSAGGRGQYRPGLLIRHHIPAARMTRAYHRQWFFWHGVSAGVMARGGVREPVPYLLGTPRYRIGALARDAAWLVPGLLNLGPLGSHTARFDSLMRTLDLFGYWYGRTLFGRKPPTLAPSTARHAADGLSAPLQPGTPR